MKRLMILVMVLLMLTAAASAENVFLAIRDGVEFGMTMDEVIAAETAAGYAPQPTRYADVLLLPAPVDDQQLDVRFVFRDGVLRQCVYQYLVEPGVSPEDAFAPTEALLLGAYGPTDCTHESGLVLPARPGLCDFRQIFTETSGPYAQRLLPRGPHLVAIDHYCVDFGMVVHEVVFEVVE